MESKFILQIQVAYNQFTKAEKKVADYVINNQEKVLYMSISDLADACDVGDTSVYRFCRTMNLQGYQEFKMKLSLSQGVAKRKSVEANDTEDIAEMIMRVGQSAIHETFTLLNRNDLTKVLKLFNEAKRIYFYGTGDSLLTAQTACNKFLRLTNKVSCISDPHMQSMAAAMSGEEDLFLLFSYSGASKDTIHVAKTAKEAGAKTVAISHFYKSPLSTYVDIVLLCGAEEQPLEGGSLAGKMGQLYLIDLLYHKYYEENYDECKENNTRTSGAVVNKLY